MVVDSLRSADTMAASRSRRNLPKDILSRWDAMVHRVWSEQTIYPQTMHEMLTLFGSDRHVAYDVFLRFVAGQRDTPDFLSPAARPPLLLPASCTPAPLLATLMAKKLGGRLYRHLRGLSVQLMPHDLHEFASVSEAMTFLRDDIPAPAHCLRWP